MGGLIIYVSLVSTTLLCTRPSNLYVWLCMGVYTVLTLLGFWDDSLKIRKKKSKGLDSKIKWLVQALLAFTVLCIALAQPTTANAIVQLWVPFYKNALLNPMPYWLLFLFFFLVMCGSSNAINLTDGIDGLAIGCTITVAMSYAILCYLAGHHHIAHYLLISHVPEAAELAVVCMALVGASLSFLWYNAHPAQVFMGDTGSLALGGLIGTIAFLAHQPFTLVVIGGIFVVEALSVILQVSSFKLRGKRIFKMSPLHHHFELSGWHENKVVIRFWIFSLLFALLGLATLKIR
jgi:phospho-N-acetylmuramoyl-pentapeptide-transferase